MARASLIGLMGLGLSVSACGDELTRWRDPEVVVADDVTSSHGPSTLLVGFGQGAAFVPLDEVPIQVVVRGLQGGSWTMPTLRADTLAATLAVTCSLVTHTGELLGATDVSTPTRPAPDGWVEVGLLPIPVSHAVTTSSIADLEGVAATLSCSVAAAGSSASANYSVTLDVP